MYLLEFDDALKLVLLHCAGEAPARMWNYNIINLLDGFQGQKNFCFNSIVCSQLHKVKILTCVEI